MDKPILSSGSALPLYVQQYERYLPTAFDESMTILEKLNKVIIYLNQIGELTNDTLDQWNNVMNWVMNDGLEDAVIGRLETWLENGTLETLIQNLLTDLKSQMDGLTKSMTDLQNGVAKVQSVVTITNPNDITSDVLTALEKVKNGGILFIPYGDYTMKDFVELYPNVKVTAPLGTIIRKTLDSSSDFAFIAGMSRGTSGYGGGGKNITIENLTFIGIGQDGTTYKANNLAFNHVDNLILKNLTFTDAMYAGHCMDLAGCSNVEIANCIFAGQYTIVGREYAEAIQIDSSTPDGIGNWVGVDGLPTIHVNVHHCQFIPSSISPAPNPIGNHGYTGTEYYDDIVFDHNYILDGQSSENAGWRGLVHFYGTKNLKITNNHFVNTKSTKTSAIELLTSQAGRYDPVTMVAGEGIPLPIEHVEITGNIFEGFNTIDNAYYMIRAYGTMYNNVSYPVVDINVSDNQFINCGSASMNVDEGNKLIMIYHFRDAVVRGNVADSGQMLASIWDGQNATFCNNITKNMANAMFYTADNTNVTANGNIGNRVRRPIECEEIFGLTCIGNVATDILIKNTDDYAYKFRNVSNAIIADNVAQSNTNDIAYGYYVYDTLNESKNINNFDNIADGFTTRAYNVSGSANFINYNARP